MRKQLTFTILSLTAMLTGCAGTGGTPYTPPAGTNTDYSEAYDADFSSVWNNAVDWFATNNIPIKNIEKDSGIISSEYTLGSDATQLDCGSYEQPATVVKPNFTANINILIRERDGFVNVNPNVFGSGEFGIYTVFGDKAFNFDAERCISTGEVEKSLHQYLESKL